MSEKLKARSGQLEGVIIHRLVSFGELKEIAQISDTTGNEIAVTIYNGDGIHTEFRIGEGRLVRAPNPMDRSIDGVDFHTHPLPTNGDSRSARLILPGHNFGDVDFSVMNSIRARLSGVEERQFPGINIITSFGLTMFVGYLPLVIDHHYYDWKVVEGLYKGLTFRHRTDREFNSIDLQIIANPLLFKYRSGDFGVGMYFLYCPWIYIEEYCVENQLTIHDLVFGDGLFRLRKHLSLRQPLTRSLSEATEQFYTLTDLYPIPSK